MRTLVRVATTATALAIVCAIAPTETAAQVLPDPATDSVDQAAGQVLDATDPTQVAEEPDAPQIGQMGEPTQLVSEREVFGYPSFERRNPFQALLTADAGGPRFEDLRLTAIVMSSLPGQSVALFTVGQAPQAEGGLGPAPQSGAPRALRARVGERIGGGNVQVVEIQDGIVTVEVEEFGARERRTLRVTRPGGGQGGLK